MLTGLRALTLAKLYLDSKHEDVHASRIAQDYLDNKDPSTVSGTTEDAAMVSDESSSGAWDLAEPWTPRPIGIL